MALNPASLTEETILKIDLTNPKSISRCLRQHLHEAPKAWLRVLGCHSATSQQTSQLERVVDFDLKFKGLNARLLQVEVGGIDGNTQVFSMGTSDHNSSTLDEETIQRCCQAVIDLENTGPCTWITLEKETREIDLTGIQRTMRSSSIHALYGGNIDVTFYDTTSLRTIQPQVREAQSANITIKTSWVFQWPIHNSNTPSNTANPSWQGRISSAMVGNEQGWIAKNDPIPPGIQICRALKKYDLVYDKVITEVYRENGVVVGGSSRSSFHRWGRDE